MSERPGRKSDRIFSPDGDLVRVSDSSGHAEIGRSGPRTAVFGQDAYPTVHHKAAALLHSLVSNHGLVDGNKRLGWLCAVVFCFINGFDIDAPDGDAYAVVIAIANGSLNDIDAIATNLAAWSAPLDPTR